ncbi:von Willebrand factor type A [Oleiphilus messinensis]|uniref:von Willebrand factor type A n=1 Tax=Oleiphilus messinensis TaxID=141451 RepID=A0A1Y0IID9_9GAMM|nr:vWA domain-containing protein [Oleiphilus messinensis]ARU59285.1 von Willebrand factor type A [Oleiphilus messinensis]
MKAQITRSIILMAALTTPVASYAKSVVAQETPVHTTAQSEIHQPRIQLALLLDTSNSMDGLINQARNQIWQMVDEFASARKNGLPPIVEVAILEYGNDNLSAETGYIRKVTALTTELDRVSEALFALTTNGGSEYCGYAIETAVNQLQWSDSPHDLKTIIIAGNEPFTQGPRDYRKAIAAARSKDININTIFAGQYQKGIQTGWQQGAHLAQGNYMNIDQNQVVTHIAAPQDQRLAQLNEKLNDTYIPYGQQGQESAQRQQEQDQKSQSIAPGLLSKRAKSKASSAYKNEQWDLVDALDSGTTELEAVDKAMLPAPMQRMSDKEQVEYIESKKQERKAIQEEIQVLVEAREAFVAEQSTTPAEEATVSGALMKAVKSQAQDKSFSFE